MGVGLQFNSFTRKVFERNYHIYLVIVIAIAFNVLTIRGGHQWNGDFALYVAHAKNIAMGLPYAETGHIYNPNAPLISPVTYPPVYPLFLSPVYRIFGLDIHAMKLAGLVAFAIFLLIFHRYTIRRLDSQVSRFAVVVAVAFSPWVWIFKDQILPDFLFMLFTYAAILFIDARTFSGNTIQKIISRGVCIGLLAYLSYGTRSLGFLLIPALIMSDLTRCRAISRSTMICILVFAGLYFAQNAYLHSDQSYLHSYMDGLTLKQDDHIDSATIDTAAEPEVSGPNLGKIIGDVWSRMFSNVAYYHNVASSYWGGGINVTVEKVIYLAMGVLAIVGFIGVVLKKPYSGDYFLVVYVIVLLLVPFRQNRYLLPLVPLYFIYILQGVEHLSARLTLPGRASVTLGGILQAGVLLTVMFSYVVKYNSLNFGNLANGVEKKESVEMFNFVRQKTPEDSLIVFREPRILSLFSGRRSTIHHWPDNPDDLWEYIVEIGATHIVLQKRSAGIAIEDDYMSGWITHYEGRLSTIFENNDFYVYQIDAS